MVAMGRERRGAGRRRDKYIYMFSYILFCILLYYKNYIHSTDTNFAKKKNQMETRRSLCLITTVVKSVFEGSGKV